MKHAVAVACDMNPSFGEAFRERYPAIKTVFDHFHIVKNFNDKVMPEVWKDEHERLMTEGREEEAKHLKGSRHILASKRETLEKHDAAPGTVINQGNALFNMPVVVRKPVLAAKHDEPANENKLPFTADPAKGLPDEACKATEAKKMASSSDVLLASAMPCKTLASNGVEAC